MCISKRYITNYYGQSVFVPCGHCPACLQSKALMRANRIRNNFSPDGHFITLFVTLTYRWDAVPYFKYSEFKSLEPLNDTVDLPIYRDSVSRYKRVDSTYNTRRVSEHRTVRLTTYEVPSYEHFKSDRYTWIRHNKKPIKDKVGISYLPDIQNFFKRLRSKLHYEGFNLPFKFYYCSEYGPTTCRPHFHALLFIPSWAFEVFKSAIVHSWPFDFCDLTAKNIEIARNAASYVSSYVNSFSSVPSLFRHVRKLSARHQYSKYFGFFQKSLSFSEIQKSILSGDCSYNAERIKHGVPVVERVLLPKYVISRYFPKFKGYCKISDNDIISILLQPDSLSRFSYSLGYSGDDLKSNVRVIKNKMANAKSFGLSCYDYAHLWLLSWKARSRKVLHDWYDSINKPSDLCEQYDNLIDLVTGRVHADFESVWSEFPQELELNPNLFNSNLVKHVSLFDAFCRYSKDRKVRSMALSSESFNI